MQEEFKEVFSGFERTTCAVRIAKFFLNFMQDEFCGKCVPCRIGTQCMAEILEGILRGDGKPEDIDRLQRLARTVTSTSFCGLGQTAPNLVLTTIRYFKDEYESHIRDKCCRVAGKPDSTG